LLCLLGNNLIYGQTESSTDSVLFSIDEVRVMAKVLNENAYLRNENVILDSIIVVNNKHIYLLSNNVTLCRSITEQQLMAITSYQEMDRIRFQQIENIMLSHKKEKRMTAIRFGGGGIAIGMLLMLLFK
jgi:hypothetical protein